MHRKFQCKARNTIGESKMTFELNIGQLPQPPILDKYAYENGMQLISYLSSNQSIKFFIWYSGFIGQ